jgi:glycosyltransferase involved in cell wall biosynthesis
VEASPALSVTFHTVLDSDGFPWAGVFGALGKLRVRRAVDIFNAAVHNHRLAYPMHRMLRWAQATKPFGIVMHGRREARLMRDLHGYRNVVHHPLAFVPADEVAEIRARTTRADFPQLSALPADAVLVGTFGFISEYKGFETAIQALRLLPETHHLLVFGGVHPQRIQRHQPIDPYLQRLLREGRIGRNILDVLGDSGRDGLRIDGTAGALLEAPPQDLTQRIHFMGALNDDAFARAMAVCDVVVMPYHEVGQTSSGALAMAIDMGCRVVASRTRNFLQLGRALPDRMEFFDIGNFSELAQRIATPGPRTLDPRSLPYNTDTNAATYRRLHEEMLAGRGRRRGAPAAQPEMAEG